MRGLKLLISFYTSSLQVAPYVGAWIETRITLEDLNKNDVAPYVGAWIETPDENFSYEYAASHPTWVRGLKHNVKLLIN